MPWPDRRRVRAARLAVSLSWLGPLLAPARDASAEPDGSSLSRAHDAYARGAAAFAQGDYARAARELSLADDLVPDSVTLRAALEAVVLADDPVLGVELLSRAKRDAGLAGDAPLTHAASVAADRFAHRTGAIVVHCDDCLAVIDGAPARVGAANVVLPGVHSVTVQRRRSPESRLVSVAADETREVVVRARDLTATAPPEGTGGAGVSPAWFIAAAGASVALGAVALWSLVDTAGDHADFVNARCGQTGAGSCPGLAATGQAAQTRTTWLGVGTGVAAIGTASLGVFGVRWHSARLPDATLGVSGAAGALRVAF